jgi:hypothetical protein
LNWKFLGVRHAVVNGNACETDDGQQGVEIETLAWTRRDKRKRTRMYQSTRPLSVRFIEIGVVEHKEEHVGRRRVGIIRLNAFDVGVEHPKRSSNAGLPRATENFAQRAVAR